MSQRLKDFLAGRMEFNGLAAWGARLSPAEFTSHSRYEWLSANRLEQTHGDLAAAAQRLAQYHLRPSRCCWVFEHIRIYFAARADGTSLACYTQNAPAAPVAEIEKVLEDFLS